MEVSKKEAPEKLEPIEKKPALTHEQRRAHDESNRKAQETYQRLCDRYHGIFMDNSPDDEIVTLTQKEFDAKWRLYCKRQNLVPAAFPMFSDYIKKFREDYDALLKLGEDKEPEPPDAN